ncbi:MAG: hypothetical protein KJ571_03930 [Bacteroidetes bacterium]|nr:hypothetical protein [Bacteroidota bacterium]
MKKINALLILLFFLAGSISAQTLSGSLMLGLPQGEFKDNIDKLGYGLQVQGTLSSPGIFTPFSIGVSAAYMVYGNESRQAPLSVYVPDVTVDVDRSYNLANFHLLALVSPLGGPIRPYVEGLVGGTYLFTTTEVKGTNNDEKFASSTNFDDFAFSYGFGGGILINLVPGLGIGPDIYLDLKARYLLGSESEYLTEGSVVINPANSSITYNAKKSTTDLLSIHIGVAAYF